MSQTRLEAAYTPMRLDTYLQTQHPQISRAQLQRLIRCGLVTVNNDPVYKNGYLVKEADAINIDYKFNLKPDAADMELPLLYEDNDCAVIDKSTGVLTHSKGEFNLEPTVADWLAARPGFSFTTDEINRRSGIVHRLDRATSGVMICAKNPAALKHLQKQFQDKKAKKTYVARIEGGLPQEKAMIDLPIERNPKQPQRFRVGQNGKPAQTAYRIIQTVAAGKTTDRLLELAPYSGRTHQLRVHLHYLGHPIVGDTFYGGRPASRLFLHAHKLEVTLPDSKRVTFESGVPASFYESEI